MDVLITGGTGFIGGTLTKALMNNGHQVSILTRDHNKVKKGVESFEDISEINHERSFDAIINLAGAPIDKCWTASYKKILLDSRVNTTRNILSLIMKLNNKPKVLISASAVGFYGNQGQREVNELSEPHDEFTHQLCKEWESVALRAEAEGVRVCITRLGVVLGEKGGALKKMLPAFKFGLGGRLGNGNQYFSWVHIDDVVSAFLYLLNNDNAKGIYNLTSPNPITNQVFTKALSKQLNRPAIIPMPEFVIKILFGEMGKTLLLGGQRVVPQRLKAEGFDFKYSNINQSFEDILK